jgi:hypothetical protein
MYLPKDTLEKIDQISNINISNNYEELYTNFNECQLEEGKQLLVLRHVHNEDSFIVSQDLQCRFSFLRDIDEKKYIND